MRTWFTVSSAALLALAALGLTGCADAGQLRDTGAAPAVAERPSPSPLWPAAATAPAQPLVTPSGQPAPSPLPGITAPGDRIEDVAAATVLQKDASLRPEERLALTGCPRCEVRPAQYRDLTGDGRSELITAVVTADHAYLHVYTLRERQVVPILDVQVWPGFTADTVGPDLVVREQTGQAAETISTYQWNAVRMALHVRQTVATGSAADLSPGLPASPGLPSGVSPEPSVSAAPTARPTAHPQPVLPIGPTVAADPAPVRP